MSRLLAIAAAVTAELNATTWSQAFTAEAVLVQVLDYKKMGEDLHVFVRGVKTDRVQVTRGHAVDRCTIEICALRRMKSKAVADVGPYVAVLEEIRDHFLNARLANDADVFVASAVLEPPFDEQRLAEKEQFTGLVILEATDWS